MTENGDKAEATARKKPLSLPGGSGKLEIRRTDGASGPNLNPNKVQQQFSHGRVKTVVVETKRRRGPESGQKGGRGSMEGVSPDHLTDQEKDARMRAVRQALYNEESLQADPDKPKPLPQNFPIVVMDSYQPRKPEKEAPPPGAGDEIVPDVVETKPAEIEPPASAPSPVDSAPGDAPAARTPSAAPRPQPDLGGEETGKSAGRRTLRPSSPKSPGVRWREEQRRRLGKLTVSQALSTEEAGERTRSLASVRRARERARRSGGEQTKQGKLVRDVVIPETITVGELASRMAERSSEVVKRLMRMGVMATITQTIDADSAELIATELGHRVKRVAAADIEADIEGKTDKEEELRPRPPVVTVMGHVNHGKTSLLDALRNSSVAAGEAGSITQHIGAYQITVEGDRRITFFDTPGHEAFSKMRARGANLTDLVVLVVAANDGVMPQTIEAVNHARAASVPIIVAINKCDLPEADPDRTRENLLRHDIVVEKLGGETLDVEISAIKNQNLDKLIEAILLQTELLDPRANPNRTALGVIVESRLDRGRGAVATVLVRNGSLRTGDAFVAGREWGRVRAILDEHGVPVKTAFPSSPVEVLGFQASPRAGDDFVVVSDENRAREIAAYRKNLNRSATRGDAPGGTVEQMFDRLRAKEKKEVCVIIKADAQGSAEAITDGLKAIETEEISIRVLHSGVGAINETDISLAVASRGMVIGFNVRAIAQARDLAKRDGVEIRYYSTIYRVAEDLTSIIEGMAEPEIQENIIGSAEVRKIFEISKVGKIAGCQVTSGIVRRSASIRLLRDAIVIYDGRMRSLRRFTDEAKEVANGLECGVMLENMQDLREGDVIECYERVVS